MSKVQLYQFPRNRKTINLSPFCLKIETYLRMAEIPFDSVVYDVRKSPRGKLPFIDDSGHVVPDSCHIVEFLKAKYGDKLDGHLTQDERRKAHLLRRFMEEAMMFPLLWCRWVEFGPVTANVLFGRLPKLKRWVLTRAVLSNMATALYHQGTGRHTREQIQEVSIKDFDVLAAELGEKPYFLGEKPTSLDCTAFGFLNNVVNDFSESPVKDSVRKNPHFIAYCDRIKQRYFADLKS